MRCRRAGSFAQTCGELRLESTSVRPNKRLLLSGRKRLRRRVVFLIDLVCGGFGTPRSRSAGR